MTTQVSKAVIVTGAARGIGKDIALRLAADGYAVAISYARNHQQAEAVVAQIQAQGGRIEARSTSVIAQARLGQPLDIANAVSFLDGKDGGWVNAQIIRVNGGFA